ncbi:hypothetical protein G9464_00930 [Halostella sp. JP-L12]|uniref:hypothetical protein n=1 Tax=Halostella TaxID=1843185 RepID=UPI000EF7DC91|nr:MULTISPECIES: hypothetical protein [Halostella]NHN46163.1 hypothetical protein [Halostella sp. JP-L12]
MPSISRRRILAAIAASGAVGGSGAADEACVGRGDPNGGVVWSRTYGEDADVELADAVVRSDGYALAGAGPDDRGWLRRIDGDGAEHWHREYGADGDRSVEALTASDGGYVLAGAAEGYERQFVTRTDADGREEWTETVEVAGYPAFVAAGSDGSIALGVTERRWSQSSERWSLHLSAIGPDGDVRERRSFDGYENRRVEAGLATGDGVLVAGEDDTDDRDDGWLWEVAVDGGIEVERTATFDREIVAIDRHEDGAVVIAGTNQTWLARLDSEWNVEWERSEFDGAVEINDVTAVPDGVLAAGYLWAGCARKPWAFRTDPAGTESWAASDEEPANRRWQSALPAGDGERVVAAGTDYEDNDAVLSLVEEPEPNESEPSTTATTAVGTSTGVTTNGTETSDDTETGDDPATTTEDESTAGTLNGFGLGAAVAALTAAAGYRARRNRRD